MKLYVYHFNCRMNKVEKEIVEVEVEVEEKPKTYKVKEGSFPFRYVTIISKEEVDDREINTRDLTYISKSPDTAVAVRMFRRYWGDKMEAAKKNADTYQNYYGSCFAYHEDGKGVMVP